MADTDIIGTWQTGSLWEWPEELLAFKEIFSTIADFIITVLEIAVTILELVKAFMIGYLDPLFALVQFIIGEIENFIRDLQQMGVFLSGDWGLVNWPFEDLLGGYQAYERRMVSRFTDRTDPNRPDVSPSSQVLSLFLYSSVDATAVYQLYQLVRQFANLFNFTPSANPLPQCAGLKASYGNEDVGIFGLAELFEGQFKSGFTGDPPQMVNLKWQLARTVRRPLGITVPLPPPPGFLIEVSTVQEGLPVYFDRGDQAQPTKVEGNDGEQVEPRQSAQVMDPAGEQPLVVFGGADVLDISRDLEFNRYVDSDGNLKDGARRVYAKLNQSEPLPIPLDQLKLDDGTYLLQRTFIHRTGSVPTPGLSYGASILYEDLPHAATISESNGEVTLEDDGQAPVYYIRVSSIDKAVTQGGDPGEDTFLYKFLLEGTQLDSPGQVRALLPPTGSSTTAVSFASKSQVSLPLEITVPSENTTSYLNSLATALAILVLSRSDLSSIYDDDKISDEDRQAFLFGADTMDAEGFHLRNWTQYPQHAGSGGTATNLESFKALVAEVVREDDPSVYFAKEVTAVEFRGTLYQRCMDVARQLYTRSGPLSGALEEMVVASTEELTTFKWSDLNGTYGAEFPEQTILESLYPIDPTTTEDQNGLGINLQSLFVGKSEQLQWFRDNRLLLGWDGEFLSYTQKPWPYILRSEEVILRMLGRTFGEIETQRFEDWYTVFQEAQEDGRCFEVDGERKCWVPAKGRDSAPSTLPSAMKLSVEDFPVLYSDLDAVTELIGGWAVTCRGAFRVYNNGVLYDQAQVVLNIAVAAQSRAVNDTQWIALRWPGSWPPIERLTQTILNWMATIQEGVKAVTDALIAYINFIESRIIELQNLIRRIQAIIDSIVLFEVPEASYLVTFSSGTDGTLTDFISADNKPQDSIANYGAGAVAVFPIIPAMGFLINLMFPESGLET